jgi:hypothetical protein
MMAFGKEEFRNLMTYLKFTYSIMKKRRQQFGETSCMFGAGLSQDIEFPRRLFSTTYTYDFICGNEPVVRKVFGETV